MRKFLGNRKTFWIITFGYLIVSSLGIIFSEYMYLCGFDFNSLAFFVFLIPFLVASIYRCHELKWSGWRILSFAIPLVNSIFLLELLFLPPRGLPSDS